MSPNCCCRPVLENGIYYAVLMAPMFFFSFFFFLKSKFATVYNSRGRVSLMLVNAHFTALENSAAGCVDDPEKQAVVDLY